MARAQTFFLVEVPVTTAHREPIRFPHGWHHGHNLDRKIEISYRSTHDGALLKVLLPEKMRTSGRSKLSGLQTTVATTKAPGPENSTQRICKLTGLNEGVKMSRIELLYIWGKDDRNASFAAQCFITR
ncbi:hypothetical protein BCCGELA001_28650 [Bradyrhizobium sp. CCGE-LA001]|nr:hypothetical protein BCCGELA001_28650 [Bradyrhizobium sp. CCGE-LA001]